ELAQPRIVDPTPAFVRVPDVLAQRTRLPQTGRDDTDRGDVRGWPMPALAARRRQVTIAASNVDLSMRLRQRAVPRELPVPPRTTVLARPAATAAQASRRHDGAATEAAGPTRAEWAPVSPPAINVEALTSQVLQQMDRRLLAYRERMGRV